MPKGSSALNLNPNPIPSTSGNLLASSQPRDKVIRYCAKNTASGHKKQGTVPGARYLQDSLMKFNLEIADTDWLRFDRPVHEQFCKNRLIPAHETFLYLFCWHQQQ